MRQDVTVSLFAQALDACRALLSVDVEPEGEIDGLVRGSRLGLSHHAAQRVLVDVDPIRSRFAPLCDADGASRVAYHWVAPLWSHGGPGWGRRPSDPCPMKCDALDVVERIVRGNAIDLLGLTADGLRRP
ncbi:hypothetical protein SLA_3146 [Streptomyces laurentii]|uniref:Uncharacterized protein n=1 Tax=Streptomyces laurentii TaxID=39478 RepID=A0A160P163_STRLU|nr:hypothetical protein SLA_3146 [Streptomyces laurentii]